MGDSLIWITRRNVSGYAMFLEGVLVTIKSAMLKIVALSVTEAETLLAVQCMQDMLYEKCLIESKELQVDTPMEVQFNNSGAAGLANNWSSGGRTRRMVIKMFFLRDLHEAKIIKIKTRV